MRSIRPGGGGALLREPGLNRGTAFTQRIESHPGAVILATNLKQNLDEAFLRRLDFVVDFPFPESAARRRIWALAIPPAAPTADDVDIDFLADRFKLSGGS